MGFSLSIFFFLSSLPLILAQDVTHTTIVVDGSEEIAKTDDNFVCATLDWWPHDKCNYNQCPWGYNSIINLDLSHPLLAKAVQAFQQLRIRLGGSLQDRVVYDVGSLSTPCYPFQKMKDGLFGFSKGCLHMKWWDDLNNFFRRTGAIVTLWIMEQITVVIQYMPLLLNLSDFEWPYYAEIIMAEVPSSIEQVSEGEFNDSKQGKDGEITEFYELNGIPEERIEFVAPPKGLAIGIVVAEKSDRWDTDTIQCLQSLANRQGDGFEGKVSLHVLPIQGIGFT